MLTAAVDCIFVRLRRLHPKSYRSARRKMRSLFGIPCFTRIAASVLLCSMTDRCGEVDELTVKAEFIFKGTLQKVKPTLI
jgi:hypothetical protein